MCGYLSALGGEAQYEAYVRGDCEGFDGTGEDEGEDGGEGGCAGHGGEREWEWDAGGGCGGEGGEDVGGLCGCLGRWGVAWNGSKGLGGGGRVCDTRSSNALCRRSPRYLQSNLFFASAFGTDEVTLSEK